MVQEPNFYEKKKVDAREIPGNVAHRNLNSQRHHAEVLGDCRRNVLDKLFGGVQSYLSFFIGQSGPAMRRNLTQVWGETAPGPGDVRRLGCGARGRRRRRFLQRTCCRRRWW